MSTQEQLADLRAELRELRSYVQQLHDPQRESSQTQVRLARATGDELSNAQPFIFLTGNGDDRGEQHAIAQMVDEPQFLAFFHDGQWHGIKVGGDTGDTGCECSIVEVLTAVAERAGAPLLSGEAAQLNSDCGCGSSGSNCPNCANDMPSTLDVLVAITQLAEFKNAINYETALNTTHTINMSGCTGSRIIDAGVTTAELETGQGTVPAGTPIRARIVVTAGLQMVVTIDFEIESDGWQLFDNVGGLDLAKISPYDCQGIFEIIQSTQGFASTQFSASISQTPSSPPPEPFWRKVTDTTYNVVETDRLLLIDATSNNVTINLQAAAEQSWDLAIKRIDSSGNTATIDGDGAETIDGALTLTLNSQYDSVILRPDDTGYYRVTIATSGSVGELLTDDGNGGVTSNSGLTFDGTTFKLLSPTGSGKGSLVIKGDPIGYGFEHAYNSTKYIRTLVGGATQRIEGGGVAPLELKNGAGSITTSSQVDMNGPILAPISAPLNIQVDGAGRAFVLSRTATEYIDLIQGGVLKGFRGYGTVPFVFYAFGTLEFGAGSHDTDMTLDTSGALLIGTPTVPSANAGPSQLIFGDTGTLPTPGSNTAAIAGDDDGSGNVCISFVEEGGNVWLFSQQAALTTQLTTITHVAPGTPDYAVQDLVDSGVGSAFGFATKDEGNTLLSVVANLQVRVAELEAGLKVQGNFA